MSAIEIFGSQVRLRQEIATFPKINFVAVSTELLNLKGDVKGVPDDVKHLNKR